MHVVTFFFLDSATQNLYLSYSRGVDTSDCSTSTTPCKTLFYALGQIGNRPNLDFIVNLLDNQIIDFTSPPSLPISLKNSITFTSPNTSSIQFITPKNPQMSRVTSLFSISTSNIQFQLQNIQIKSTSKQIPFNSLLFISNQQGITTLLENVTMEGFPSFNPTPLFEIVNCFNCKFLSTRVVMQKSLLVLKSDPIKSVSFVRVQHSQSFGVSIQNNTFSNIVMSVFHFYNVSGSLFDISNSQFNQNFMNVAVSDDYPSCILLEHVASPISIFKTRFINNTAMEDGCSVVGFDSQSISIENSTFVNNFARAGSAILIQELSSISIRNSLFLQNRVTVLGVTILIEVQQTIQLDNNEFAFNLGEKGSAMFVSKSKEIMMNRCVMRRNSIYPNTIKEGGAISISTVRNVTIQSSVFFANDAAFGGAAYLFICDTVSILNSSFLVNRAMENGGAFDISFVNSLSVLNSQFLLNKAIQGTGGAMSLKSVFLRDTDFGILHGAYFVNNRFFGNTAGSMGGALSFNQQYIATLSNCEFIQNKATVYSGGVVYFVGSSTQYVRGKSRVTQFTELPGVTIEHCLFESNYAQTFGGGIRVNSESVWLQVISSKFVKNYAAAAGASLALNALQVSIISCYFDSEIAPTGGSVVLQGTPAMILDSVFIDGLAEKGGSIYIDNENVGRDDVAIINCEFLTSYAIDSGGVIYVNRINGLSIESCSMTDSWAGVYGGVIHFQSVSNTTITNCQFNQSTSLLGGSFSSASSTPDSILFSETNVFINSCASVSGHLFYSLACDSVNWGDLIKNVNVSYSKECAYNNLLYSSSPRALEPSNLNITQHVQPGMRQSMSLVFIDAFGQVITPSQFVRPFTVAMMPSQKEFQQTDWYFSLPQPQTILPSSTNHSFIEFNWKMPGLFDKPMHILFEADFANTLFVCGASNKSAILQFDYSFFFTSDCSASTVASEVYISQYQSTFYECQNFPCKLFTHLQPHRTLYTILLVFLISSLLISCLLWMVSVISFVVKQVKSTVPFLFINMSLAAMQSLQQLEWITAIVLLAVFELNMTLAFSTSWLDTALTWIQSIFYIAMWFVITNSLMCRLLTCHLLLLNSNVEWRFPFLNFRCKWNASKLMAFFFVILLLAESAVILATLLIALLTSSNFAWIQTLPTSVCYLLSSIFCTAVMLVCLLFYYWELFRSDIIQSYFVSTAHPKERQLRTSVHKLIFQYILIPSYLVVSECAVPLLISSWLFVSECKLITLIVFIWCLCLFKLPQPLVIHYLPKLPRKKSLFNKFASKSTISNDEEYKLGLLSNDELNTISSSQYYIDFNDLKLVEEIGIGSQGVVFLGEYNHAPVAIKAFKRTNFGSDSDVTEFLNETQLLMQFSNHPNIVRFIGVSEDKKRDLLLIITEYCPYGSLEKLFKQNSNSNLQPTNLPKVKLNFAFKVKLLYGIACGMQYLHKASIIHRDLKCENVLLDAGLQPKIIDFGFSKVVKKGQSNHHTMSIGTAGFVAPEVLIQAQLMDQESNGIASPRESNKKQAVSIAQYDERCDIYSFGMIMYCLLCETSKPFGNIGDIDIIMKVVNSKTFRPSLEHPKVQETIEYNNRWYVDLMAMCWSWDVRARPLFDEIVNVLKARLS